MKRFLIGIGLFCCLAIYGVWLGRDYLFLEPGVTQRNYGLLCDSMSEQEVEAILGMPGVLDAHGNGRYTKHWESEECTITLTFTENYGLTIGTMKDKDGKVSDRVIVPRSKPSFDSFFEYLYLY